MPPFAISQISQGSKCFSPAYTPWFGGLGMGGENAIHTCTTIMTNNILNVAINKVNIVFFPKITSTKLRAIISIKGIKTWK
jgi:hypothetical protein